MFYFLKIKNGRETIIRLPYLGGYSLSLPEPCSNTVLSLRSSRGKSPVLEESIHHNLWCNSRCPRSMKAMNQRRNLPRSLSGQSRTSRAPPGNGSIDDILRLYIEYSLRVQWFPLTLTQPDENAPGKPPSAYVMFANSQCHRLLYSQCRGSNSRCRSTR